LHQSRPAQGGGRPPVRVEVTEASGTPGPAGLLLRGGRSARSEPFDVAVDTARGTISATGAAISPDGFATVVDCSGMVVLAAPVDPHAHLDKALSGLMAPNPAGHLEGAITAWHAYWPQLTHEDLVARATAAVEAMVLRGTTAIRSHVDVGAPLGMRAVRAMLAVRDDVRARGLADLQLVALVSIPLCGHAGAEHRRLLDQALDLGVDVAGGVPYLDTDPFECTRLAVDAAGRYGVGVDLHTDETTDPRVLDVRHLARMAVDRGLGGTVTASHCVSLGVQPSEVQELVAAELAAAGVAVVVLPQTNLYLQARNHRVAPPRGLTAVRALLDAGVTVAAGADNVRDPFCSMGRLDAFETAALLVMTAHLTPEEAWEVCTTAGRAVLGLPPVTVAAGSAAELLVVEGASLADAKAGAGERRVVIHQGRVVAATRVERQLFPAGRAAPVEPVSPLGR
jgi:cytosine deaminase